MISRYSVPRVETIWSEDSVFSKWTKIELTWMKFVARFHSKVFLERGFTENIEAPTAQEVRERELQTGHDMFAFLSLLEERLPENTRHLLHYSLTSSDVKDTALVLCCRESMSVIIELLYDLLSSLSLLIRTKGKQEVLGRTHGVGAMSMSLEHRLNNWREEISRRIASLRHLLGTSLLRAKLSGPVGTNSDMERVERLCLNTLGLSPMPHCTQVIPRDVFAQVLWELALTGAALERLAQNIRLLHREGELLESHHQVGSSSMPHKKNPILCERICGLSRVLRSYVLPGLENISLWEERDLTHSSVERVILPQAFHLAAYMSLKMSEVLFNLSVSKERIEQNLSAMEGREDSHKKMKNLQKSGMSYTEAHKKVRDK